MIYLSVQMAPFALVIRQVIHPLGIKLEMVSNTRDELVRSLVIGGMGCGRAVV